MQEKRVESGEHQDTQEAKRLDGQQDRVEAVDRDEGRGQGQGGRGDGQSGGGQENEMGSSKVTDKVLRVLRASKMRRRPKLPPVINLKFRKISFKKSSIGCLWVPTPKV